MKPAGYDEDGCPLDENGNKWEPNCKGDLAPRAYFFPGSTCAEVRKNADEYNAMKERIDAKELGQAEGGNCETRRIEEYHPLDEGKIETFIINRFNYYSKSHFNEYGPAADVMNLEYQRTYTNTQRFAVKEAYRMCCLLGVKRGSLYDPQKPIGPLKGFMLSGPCGVGKTSLMKKAMETSNGFSKKKGPASYFVANDLVANTSKDKGYLDKLKEYYSDSVMYIDNLGFEKPANSYGVWYDLYEVVEWRYSLWSDKTSNQVCTCFATDIPERDLLDVYLDKYRNKVVSEMMISMISKIKQMCISFTISGVQNVTQNIKGIA